MGEKYKIERDVGETVDLGETVRRIFRVSAYYYLGSGIVCTLTTLTVSRGFESHALFSHGNTQISLERIARAKPKLEAAYGKALETHKAAIFEHFTDYHDDNLWSKERRKEAQGWLRDLLRKEVGAVTA